MLIAPASEDDWVDLERFAGARRFRGYPALVARWDGLLAGYLIWRHAGPGERELLMIETAADFRRQGVARALVRKFKERSAGDLFLEVRPSNAAARELYCSEGFTEIGRRREYYVEPVEDAIVLKFRSC